MRRILLVLLLSLAAAASPLAAESSNPSPEGLELEGIYLGQPFADVNRLLDLHSYTPVTSDDGKRYTWHPQRDIDDLERLNKELDLAHRLRTIDLVFRGGQVSEVRVSYATGASFTRMGPDLEQRYGEPSSVLAPPRRSIVGLGGEPYFLWLQIWTWQWDDATLTVTGEHYRASERPNAGDEHYGVPTRPYSGNRHERQDFFRFHLTTPTDD